ncbi:MAG: hypothetical protein HC819_20635 [Cyclobacteriaceae bacterium]|nr:hypothetical protein [Cyclobacteriaceae bacterium]
MNNQETQVNFLRRIGKIEFILFAFTSAGIILNTLDIKGGKLVLGLGFNAFALLYLFVALGFRRIKTKNQFDRVASTFSYIFLSMLIISIMFFILGLSGIDVLIHFGMVSVLAMILIIQTRKFYIGLMSSDTTSLLYRLIIFWVVGLVTFYILPGSLA